MLWVMLSLIFVSVIASVIALVFIPGAFSVYPDKRRRFQSDKEKAGAQITEKPYKIASEAVGATHVPQDYRKDSDTSIETG
ncbi:MAG: hypothetical protein M0Z31_01735 [Clostridia bacterium]|nr:hypothetical protein [Clostridia bacterium]